MARLAHKIAIANPKVTSDVIEANEFPELAQRYSIRSVPKTVINDVREFVGNVSEGEFLEHIRRSLSD